MRIGWILLALLAVPLTHPLGAQTAEPTIETAVDIARFQPALATINGADLGENLVVNSHFDGSLDPWRANLGSAKAASSVSIAPGALLISVGSANGTVNVAQGVNKPDDGSLIFSYSARGDGGAQVSMIVFLRERDQNGKAIDTSYNHLVSTAMSDYLWSFTPKVSGGQVQVVFGLRARPGQTNSVRIENVQLRTGPTIAWNASGRVIGSSGLSAQIVFDQLGEISITAEGSRLGQSLWSISKSVTVNLVAPTASLQTSPPIPLLGASFALDASESFDPDSPLQLQDTSFDRLATVWRPTDSAGGSPFSASVAREGVRSIVDLSTNSASRRGALSISQTLPLHGATAAVLSVGIKSTGIYEFVFQFRERNAAGALTTTFVHVPTTAGAERRVSMPWSAKRNDTLSLTIVMSASVSAGSSAAVSFIDPRLESGLSYEFSLDGQILAQTKLPTFSVPYLGSAAHTAKVIVSDADGGKSTAALLIQVRDDGYQWSVAAPVVVPLNFNSTFDASGARRLGDLSNMVEDSRFANGTGAWSLLSPWGAGANWSVGADEGGAFGRLSVTNASSPTKPTIVQAVADTRCLSVSCSLSFDARASAGAPTLYPLMRAVQRPPGKAPTNVDTAFPAIVTSEWQHYQFDWAPTGKNLASIEIVLRFLAGGGEDAAVDFRDIRLAPTERFSWLFDGPRKAVLEGRVVTVQFPVPGPYNVETKVTDSFNFTYDHSMAVEALPLSFFPTFGGGLGIHLLDPQDEDPGQIEIRDGNGNLIWSGAPGQEPFDTNGTRSFSNSPSDWLVLAPAIPSSSVVLISTNGEVAYSAAGISGKLRPAMGEPSLEVRNTWWNSRLRMRIPVANEAVASGTATVRSRGQPIGQVPLHRSSGSMIGEFSLPWSASDRDVTIDYGLQDGWGGSASAQETRHVSANPLMLGLLGFGLLVLLSAAAVGISMRIGRRKGL